MISTPLTWKMYAYISSAWTDISSDVLITGKSINANWGIDGNSEVDRMAGTGTLTFTMNNATGKYSPNLAGALAGWKKGIPIKLVFTFGGDDYVRFRGKVDRVDIDAGTSKQRQVLVTVTDWLDYAAEFPLVQPTIATNKRADEAINTIVTGMQIQPQATSYDTGNNTFPVVFNTVTDNTRAYSEIAKLVISEMGYCYLKKDKTYGETLVFESETHRGSSHGLTSIPVMPRSMVVAGAGTTAVNGTYEYFGINPLNGRPVYNNGNKYVSYEDIGIGALAWIILNGNLIAYYSLSDVATPDLCENWTKFDGDDPAPTVTGNISETVLIDNTMTDLDVEYGANLINTMQFTAFPKEVDAAATTILFKLSQPILLASGETQTLIAAYTDPSGGGRKVNGMDMVTPAATTDYLFNTLANGTGSNITANLTVTASYGAEGVTYTLTNNYSTAGYITKLQARGKGIYNYNSISYTAENTTSCNEHGVVSRNISQPYQVTLAHGTSKAESIVMREKQPRTVLDTVYFTANNSNHLMSAFLNIDVGDAVEIKESQTGIDGQYWVNGVEFGLVDGKVVECRWYVKEKVDAVSGITLMACEFSSAGTVDALEYGAIPEADNLTQRTLSAWVYAHTSGTAGSDSKHIVGAWSGNIKGYDVGLGGGTCIHYQYSDGGAPGRWESPANSIPLNSWVHVAVTRDTTAAGTVAPVIYIGGTAQVVTEAVAPAAGTVNETGFRYMLGNIFTADYDYNRPFDGLIKDVRIYNKVLSEAQVVSLVAGGTVTDGLLFQAPAVYDGDVTAFTDKTLTATDKVIESVVQRVGTPHGSPIIRAI
jgi:hypothetical protein